MASLRRSSEFPWRAGAAAAAAVILTAGTSPLFAADTNITPRISVFQWFTDNVDQQPSGRRRSDFITAISPGIAVNTEGSRIRFVLDYDLDVIRHWRDDDDNRNSNRLFHIGTAELSRELFFIDTRASITQERTTSTGGVSPETSVFTTNRTEVRTYSLSPYIRNHFGDFADSELRYTFAQTTFSEGAFADALSHRLTGQLVSGLDYSRFLWTVFLDAEEVDRSDDASTSTSVNRDISRKTAELRTQYLVNRFVAILASGGYEKIEDPTLTKEPDGPIGALGVRIQPGPRTIIEGGYNYRFDDYYPSFFVSYLAGAATRLTASYTEGLQIAGLVFQDNLGFLATDEFGNYIDRRTARQFQGGNTNFGLTNDGFRTKRFTGGLTSTQDRNRYDLLVYYDERFTETTGLDEQAIGGAFNWGREISLNTGLNTALRYRKVDFGTADGRIDSYYNAGANLVRTLSETLRMVISYNFVWRDSNIDASDYTENIVGIGLVKTF